MVIVIHVLIALSGVVLSSIALISPSRRKLRLSYGAVLATIVSGAYLVISTHSNLTQACLTGLLYIGFTTSMLIVANRRLAAAGETNRIDDSI